MRDKPKTLADGSVVTYLEYKERMEFDTATYQDLARTAHDLGLDFGVSVWDTVSPHWAADTPRGEEFETPHVPLCDFIKLPSATIADEAIVHHAATRGLPLFWSTGMYDMAQIQQTTEWLDSYGTSNWGIFHCNSTYPADPSELNLRVIDVWHHTSNLRGHPIGYSGHEVGLATTVAAVALGANMVERHITLDRASWGSDQSASVEPQGFARLVSDIRTVESALGDGRKVVWPSEEAKKDSLVVKTYLTTPS
jgi:sialic acid synthase SpsE